MTGHVPFLEGDCLRAAMGVHPSPRQLVYVEEFCVYFPDDGHRLILGRANCEKVLASPVSSRPVVMQSRMVTEWADA